MDKQSILNRILREYEKKRHFAELKRLADEESAMSYPEFLELKSAINAATLREAYATPESLPEIRAELAALGKRRERLLKKYGLNDFSKPLFECKLCDDTGYAGGSPCLCLKKRLAESLRSETRRPDIKASFADCKLDLFDESVRPKLIKVYAAMKKYAENFPSDRYRVILVSGAAGAGKTFLSSCIYNAVAKGGFFSDYFTAFGLNNMFLKIHTAQADEKYPLLDGLLSLDFLAIDDLGTEPILNNLTKEYLFNLINERISQGSSTLISTNLSPSDLLSRYGERIFSRLYSKNSSLVIKLPGKDLRLI